ncbi:MAG TPA: carboxypeptidase-like regulatory domain-containing protein [Hymenobacter sp.]
MKNIRQELMENHYYSKSLSVVFNGLYRKVSLLLMLLLSGTAFAQQTIKGTVTDEKNSPLPGATVRLKDTNVERARPRAILGGLAAQ